MPSNKLGSRPKLLRKVDLKNIPSKKLGFNS